MGPKRLALLVMATSLIACEGEEVKLGRMKASMAELPPAELGEIWGAKQEAQAEVILDDMITLMKKRDADQGLLRRDAHPKAHGCAKAYLGIEVSKLPKQYQVGLFEKDRSYEAWVRYSNGDPSIKPDIEKDVRGMAVKIMNVKGTPTGSQDLVMINAEEFFSKDGDDYAALFRALKGGKLDMAFYGLTHPKSMSKLLKAMIQLGNPLAISYHSSVPYKLGPSPMRFSMVPCGPLDNSLPRDPEANYLKKKLVDTLKSKFICFDFYLQPNKDPSSTPVEDPRLAWDKRKSPVYKVGTLTLPQQEGIDSKQQQNFCENLSFDPWHSLPSQRPLGQINRMRGMIYREISRVRHENNRTKVLEPKSFKPCQDPETKALCETPSH